ncbi:MAG: rhomboid family intramembrane serine protease [Nitrososphaerota archaeon]|nr:rhomboid family intramembrane serine protease [Nitrososphaerota archaeon]
MGTCPNCGAQVPPGASFCNNCGEDLNPTVADGALSSAKKCYYCAKPLAGEDAYYYHCKYCDHDFCSQHRLPENHLCKSSPLRRNIPTTSNPYYSSSAGYYSTSGRPSGVGGFGINLSKQGRNLIILVVLGLPIGFVTTLFFIENIQAILFLVQDNYLVYQGWIPALVTSMIVVAPGYSGLVDVAFNAIAILFVDGLLRNAFTPKQYYLVFLLTGIVGNVVSLIGYGPGQGITLTTISFGASGGIFGLVAGAVAVDYAVTRRLNKGLVLWFVIIFFYSSLGGSVDIFAHAGGALAGLASGFVVGRARMGSRRR